MRKSLFFVAALAVLAVGCNKDNGPEGGQPSGESTKVSATIADNESAVWQASDAIFLNTGNEAYVYIA